MYYVGANNYRAHLSCTDLGTRAITTFTISATDASGNTATDGPHPVGLAIVGPTTAQPAAGAVIGSGGELDMDPNTSEEEVDTAADEAARDPRRQTTVGFST